jgi:general secretion pathway protein E/type IV pilus assembly protein PilB
VGVEYRLSTHPIILADRRWDENIALRVLDKESHMLSIEQLGFDHETRDALKQLAQIPFGITVITGPTGSGKTTTLYAILQLLNQQRLNIMTLEDPIEYYIPSIRQTEICPSLNLDYAQGIRSLLRQNPDVILIGEIRDAESAEMAMRAAITGHRVLTTMHTKDTFGVVQRFINLGMDLDQLRGNLAGIVNQRLLRRVCKQCQTLHTDHGIETPLQSRMMSGQGCSACRYTGYRGRFALAEIVTFSAQMRDALLVDPSQWQQRVAELGMKSLHAKALEALANEVTTACEITRVCGESR